MFENGIGNFMDTPAGAVISEAVLVGTNGPNVIPQAVSDIVIKGKTPDETMNDMLEYARGYAGSIPKAAAETVSGIVELPGTIVETGKQVHKNGLINTAGSMNPATGGDASFAMQHEFNGLAGQGILHGTEYEEYKPFDDAPGYDHPAGAKIVSGVMTALLVGAAAGLLGGSFGSA